MTVMTYARLATWVLLVAGLLSLPSAAWGQLQLRPAMQGASGLNSIPPIQGPPPFGQAGVHGPNWYYGIPPAPGYSGYYYGYYSGYTGPFEPWDYSRYSRGLTAAGSRTPVPGAPAPADRRVYIEVRVPAGAEVWFGDAPTSQTGAVRHFVSPPLGWEPRYTYHVRARWTEGGREVDRTQQLPVVPGGRYVLDFTTPQSP